MSHGLTSSILIGQTSHRSEGWSENTVLCFCNLPSVVFITIRKIWPNMGTGHHWSNFPWLHIAFSILINHIIDLDEDRDLLFQVMLSSYVVPPRMN